MFCFSNKACFINTSYLCEVYKVKNSIILLFLLFSQICGFLPDQKIG